MATLIYFVKATYEGNTYKLSDFYTGSAYKQSVNKSLEVDMAFNDGPTVLETQIRTLPDASDIRNHTHIIVPSKNKIYRIQKVDEPNYSAYRIELSDDPLIANYQSFRAEQMYMTRSNNPTVYSGLNDIPSLGTYPESYVVKNNIEVGSLSGDWLLVYVQQLDREQKLTYVKSRVSLNLGDSWTPFISETFTTFSNLNTKYISMGPFNTLNLLLEAIPFYYGKIARITSDDKYYTYSAYYNQPENKYYMTWVLMDQSYKHPVEYLWSDLYSFDGYGSTKPDINTVPGGYKFYSTTDYSLFVKEFNAFGIPIWWKIYGHWANPLPIGTNAARPVSPSNGYVYVNTSTSTIQQYYGADVWSGGDYFINLDEDPSDYTVSVFPNQPVMIFALPIQTTNIDGTNTPLLSGTAFKSLEWYNGTAWQSYNVLSARIINGSSIFNDVSTSTSGKGNIVVNITSTSTKYPNNTVSEWNVGFVTTQVLYSNISYQSTAITNYTLREPFKYHELWIYGQKYEIPSFLIHSLYMRQSINSNGLNYMIYKDPDYTDLYISGVISMEVQWSNDSLAAWVAQNPTYKDQFNLRKQQQWAETLTGAAGGIASGAIAGSVVPGIGTAAGAVMGAGQAVTMIATQAVRTHFEEKNLNLSLQTQRLLTDKLYGDTSSALQYWNIRHGIYWVVKTMNNDEQMKFQYDSVGYPTNKVVSINDMPWSTYNYTLGAYAKLVYGYFNKTIVNSYVTESINNIMKDGITLVE